MLSTQEAYLVLVCPSHNEAGNLIQHISIYSSLLSDTLCLLLRVPIFFKAFVFFTLLNLRQTINIADRVTICTKKNHYFPWINQTTQFYPNISFVIKFHFQFSRNAELYICLGKKSCLFISNNYIHFGRVV